MTGLRRQASARLSHRNVLAAVGVGGFCVAVVLAVAGWWLPAAVAVYLPVYAAGRWDGRADGLEVGAVERDRLNRRVYELDDELAARWNTHLAGRYADDAHLLPDVRRDWVSADANTSAVSRVVDSSRAASST